MALSGARRPAVEASASVRSDLEGGEEQQDEPSRENYGPFRVPQTATGISEATMHPVGLRDGDEHRFAFVRVWRYSSREDIGEAAERRVE